MATDKNNAGVKVEPSTTVSASFQRKQRKPKRSLPKTLPGILRAMKAIKERTGESATVDAVVKETGEAFGDASDLGSYIQSAVDRMNKAESMRHGTSLHKLAQVVLAKLHDTSPSDVFSVGSNSDAVMSALADEIGIDLDDADSIADAI